MTLDDETAELIAEARQWPRDGVNEGPLINALADAIEARDAEVEELRARLAKVRAVYDAWLLREAGVVVDLLLSDISDALDESPTEREAPADEARGEVVPDGRA